MENLVLPLMNIINEILTKTKSEPVKPVNCALPETGLSLVIIVSFSRLQCYIRILGVPTERKIFVFFYCHIFGSYFFPMVKTSMFLTLSSSLLYWCNCLLESGPCLENFARVPVTTWVRTLIDRAFRVL